MSRCKADPASAGPGSSNMEEQGEGEAEAIGTPDQHDVDVVQLAKIMRSGEGDAVKGDCMGGCNRLRKVCGGCNVHAILFSKRCL